MRHIDFEVWIGEAPTEQLREFRTAVHIIMHAITLSDVLPEHLVIKGGILIALAHGGDRFTRDIDFSAAQPIEELPPEALKTELKAMLIRAVEALDYDLDCRIQSARLHPPGEDKKWQTYAIKVGYAPYSNSQQHARLIRGQSSMTVKVECSYNERLNFIDAIEIEPGRVIRAYALVDLYAEKLRAMLQQPVRNRVRRQDAYDIARLLEFYGDPPREDLINIHASLITKAADRDLRVDQNSLSDPEVRRRSELEYGKLSDEIRGDLPDFDETFGRVETLFKSLPW